ncbi:Ras-related Rab-21 [Brachionus plicatilis]|uniref:Ras-related protein Rab-21 n=1 Tax=Brachionus plicatilis TaxID=10195 RepID=A0A3M7SHJ1_BRAPC|nr:Ras-related Rab-21 [Brachionus plicatilis]
MSGKSYQFKIVLLGEGCVGKTSLMLRYVQDKFNDEHLSTIQAAFIKKKIRIGSNSVELAIWDTAGQEKYHALGPIYYRGSNGAFLVYDITDIDSFERIRKWVTELKTSLGDDCILCIVGNKSDLEKNRNVPIKEAEEYAKSVGAKHYSTSAKLNQGVNELFLDISKRMIEKFESSENLESINHQSGNSSNKRNTIQVVDDSVVQQEDKKSGCC